MTMTLCCHVVSCESKTIQLQHTSTRTATKNI